MGTYNQFPMLMRFVVKGPKPNTVGDFWKMVWQEDVLVIAMVTNLTEGEKVQMITYTLCQLSLLIYFVLCFNQYMT